MTDTRVIKKNLIAAQDVAFGEGEIEQERNGGMYTLDLFRGFWPVNSAEELNAVDPAAHPKVVLVEGTNAQFFSWIGGAWTPLVVAAGAESNDKFKSTVFKRSQTVPTKPGDSEGSFANPVPVGWFDGIPAGSLTLYSTTRTFSRMGDEDDPSWAAVAQMTDTETIDYEWSSIEVNPGNPTDNPENWNNLGDETTIWQAIRTIENGVPGPWSIIKIRGENGTDGVGSDGARGGGRWYADTLPAPYTWLEDDAAANAAAQAACPDGAAVEGDVVTLFKPGDRTVSVTKIYRSGTGLWEPFAEVIDGNLLVEGTVVADDIRVGAVFGINATFEGTIYANNIEGDVVDMVVKTTQTHSWIDPGTVTGTRQALLFEVEPLPFQRSVLMDSGLVVQGSIGMTAYLRRSTTGVGDPGTWPVVDTAQQMYNTAIFSQLFDTLPANTKGYYAVYCTRFASAGDGDALLQPQPVVLSAFKAGSTIT